MSRCRRRADVAQLVAHHLAKVRVAGSNPVVRSKTPPDGWQLRPPGARRLVRWRAAVIGSRSHPAAWPSGLGKGLQSPVRGFDSRRRLTNNVASGDHIRAISSVGEHYLDTVGVTGSIPVSPTTTHRKASRKGTKRQSATRDFAAQCQRCQRDATAAFDVLTRISTAGSRHDRCAVGRMRFNPGYRVASVDCDHSIQGGVQSSSRVEYGAAHHRRSGAVGGSFAAERYPRRLICMATQAYWPSWMNGVPVVMS